MKENRLYSASTWFRTFNNLRLRENENRFNVKYKHTRIESTLCVSVCVCVCVEQNKNYQRAKFKWIASHTYILQALNMRTTQTGEKSNLFFVLWQVWIQQKSIDSWLIFVMITYHSFYRSTSTSAMCVGVWQCMSELECMHTWMTKSVENEMAEALSSKVNSNIFLWYLIICHSNVLHYPFSIEYSSTFSFHHSILVFIWSLSKMIRGT